MGWLLKNVSEDDAPRSLVSYCNWVQLKRLWAISWQPYLGTPLILYTSTAIGKLASVGITAPTQQGMTRNKPRLNSHATGELTLALLSTACLYVVRMLIRLWVLEPLLIIIYHILHEPAGVIQRSMALFGLLQLVTVAPSPLQSPPHRKVYIDLSSSL
jgi:hypothetical protein